MRAVSSSRCSTTTNYQPPPAGGGNEGRIDMNDSTAAQLTTAHVADYLRTANDDAAHLRSLPDVALACVEYHVHAGVLPVDLDKGSARRRVVLLLQWMRDAAIAPGWMHVSARMLPALAPSSPRDEELEAEARRCGAEVRWSRTNRCPVVARRFFYGLAWEVRKTPDATAARRESLAAALDACLGADVWRLAAARCGLLESAPQGDTHAMVRLAWQSLARADVAALHTLIRLVGRQPHGDPLEQLDPVWARDAASELAQAALQG
jgi:hypothetical protein